ncbi:MAG: hypothetical protein AB4372_25140 [Xenococcus sp. (in: cyanobacteria)]
MSIYNRFFVVGLTLLSISSSTSINALTLANFGTVSETEINRCQLDDKAVEQLHEIRTERRHTRVMLQRIEGINNQLINNARRQLHNRLIRIEKAEKYVLELSCNEAI